MQETERQVFDELIRRIPGVYWFLPRSSDI